jgi:hypothetical protein
MEVEGNDGMGEQSTLQAAAGLDPTKDILYQNYSLWRLASHKQL